MIGMITIAFPIIAVLVGIIGAFLFKNIYAAPSIVAIVSIILMLTVFNLTFGVWVIAYTVLAFLADIITKLIRRNA